MVNFQLLTAFDELSIHDRIDPYFEADIQLFLDSDDEFSLDLKRSTTRLALYGEAHVEIRQQFFNSLDPKMKKSLFISKVKKKGLDAWLEATFKIPLNQISHVEDIGKGRSIYKIQVQDQAFVLKEKCNANQEKYNQIADQFGIASCKATFTKINGVIWELSDYLDEQKVFAQKKQDLVSIYAKAAAFGDFIGLGDRHFENYILKNDALVAIDVSHLTEGDNDHWTKKYISGGLYEVCILQYLGNSGDQLKQQLDLFFNAYHQSMADLFAQLNQQKDGVKINWISEQQCLDTMLGVYQGALIEMFRRLPYKDILKQLVENQLNLSAYPDLKMFYYADQGRISTFFRVEELSEPIFDTIQHLADKHLGITPQFFKDTESNLMFIQDALMQLKMNRLAPSST